VVTSPRSRPFSPTGLCGRNRWLLLIMAELATWLGVTVDPPAWLLQFHLRSVVECRCSFHMALALNGPGCSSSGAVSRQRAVTTTRLLYQGHSPRGWSMQILEPNPSIQSPFFRLSTSHLFLHPTPSSPHSPHRQHEQTLGLLVLMLPTFLTQAPCLIASHQQCFQRQREPRRGLDQDHRSC
jgi:hypothetical protein